MKKNCISIKYTYNKGRRDKIYVYNTQEDRKKAK